MKYQKLPMIGPATDEEKEFTDFLLDTIADYVQKIPTERRTLICALSRACQIVFCHQTPLDVKQQCKEIDDFCGFLKSHALRNARKD
jgi:hypothetical protein